MKKCATEVCISDIIDNNLSGLNILNKYYIDNPLIFRNDTDKDNRDLINTESERICTQYNEKFKEIISIQSNINNDKKTIDNKFNDFVNNINNKLKNIKSDTIQYKLNNSFKLEYYDIGLFNNLQKSGSCTFYSYYNLAVNMKILHEYTIWKNNSFNDINTYTNNFIEVFIKFHYYNVYLYCITNDINIIKEQKLIYKFDDRNIYNHLHIYKQIEENGLYKEFVEYYDNDTLLFNKKKQYLIKYYLILHIMVLLKINHY